MREFLKRIFVFFFPPVLIIIIVTSIDIFKIFGFQDYYSNQVIGLNRGMITTTTYNHYREKVKFDSFIFGSSRSQAFKCEKWIKYLDKNSMPFHFDGSGEGLWDITKKIEYIDELGDTIKNALIILDREAIGETSPRQGHLFISMPCISKASRIEYYWEFIKASIDPKFLLAYLDYSIFNKNRAYMGSLIRRSKYNHTVNNINCDIWYGYDQEIQLDSLGYYKKLISKGYFFKRPLVNVTKCNVTSEEIEQILRIKSIFNKHKTKYKIVISPLYDQVPMEKEQVELLSKVFGQENIYNFSGKNLFTEPVYNFYEPDHYRPHVADEILRIIYININ